MKIGQLTCVNSTNQKRGGCDLRPLIRRSSRAGGTPSCARVSRCLGSIPEWEGGAYGARIGPAVAGITLGIVRQAGFPRQNGRNQAFNHAGNMMGAGLSGYLGWHFGFLAVFCLAALFGVISITAVLLIPRRIIDNRAARGLETRRVARKKKGGSAQEDEMEEQDEDEPAAHNPVIGRNLCACHQKI